MRGGPRRHSGADPAAVDHDDVPAEAAELIGRGEAGYARADHDHVAFLVGGELPGLDRRQFLHPGG
jgi:hypothetical protein